MIASLKLLIIFIYNVMNFIGATNKFTLNDIKYPCAFFDTVNITGNVAHSSSVALNGSYINVGDGDGDFDQDDILHDDSFGHNIVYNSLVIPRDLIAFYNFTIKNGIRIPVERHLRACICTKLKPCIRFCCEQGHFYDLVNHTCSLATMDYNDNGDGNNNNNNSILNQTTMLVRNDNGVPYAVETSKYFAIQVQVPCERMRLAVNDHKELIDWTLFENGTIGYKHHHFTKNYCYSPYRFANMTWIWQPLACPAAKNKLSFIVGVREWTYVVCLIIASICMVIIFLTHLFYTEMRNTFYGIAIEAYSLCIILGYSLMIHLVLSVPLIISKTTCTFIPCFILLFQLLSFYVLSVISFNFYLNFHGIVLTKLMFWVILLPIGLLAVGWSVFVALGNYAGKSIFGGEDTCWFDPRNWSVMIYLNAPILIACSVSVFFYILTLITIREREENGSKCLTSALEENRFKSFWQFFIYTFIAWLVCVISFVMNYYSDVQTHINYAVCLAIILHGFASLYALIGKNQQIQNFLKRIENDIDDDDGDDEEACENALPMAPIE